MSFANVGRRWSTSSFPAYLAGIKRPSWADSVCIHYTAAPSLAQRPHGFTAQHIENIANFYRRTYDWSRGPHLFTDEDDIFGMTPLSERGIHAVSFNSRSIGIEALGAYDTEDPLSGRGLAVMETTASATRALYDWLGIKPTAKNLLFHRFDPRTRKTCPGRKVHHDWFLDMVLAAKPGEPHPHAEPDEGGIDSLEMVQLVAYVADKTRRPERDLAAILRRDGQLYFLGEQWIEGAYYDRERQATMAPRSEADEAAAVLSSPAPVVEGMLPVVATMAERLSLAYTAAAKRLSHDGTSFLWGGQKIPGAFYDRDTQTTMAPERSIRRLLSAG